MAAGKPILCIGGKFDFDIGKILRSTKIGQIFEENDKKNKENKVVLVFSWFFLFVLCFLLFSLEMLVFIWCNSTSKNTCPYEKLHVSTEKYGQHDQRN